MYRILAFAAGFLAVAPAWGHHSFAAEFDEKKVVRLHGIITEMEWVNPHVWLHLEVKDDSGKAIHWMIEGNTPNSLLRAGLTKRSISAGMEVVVQGYLSRTGENKASGSSILLKSGEKLSLGSSRGEAGGAVLDWVSSDEELWRRQLAAARGN